MIHRDGNWVPYLNAIADGAETRHEQLTGHSEAVIQKTATLGRSLGIPEDQIQEWADERRRQIIEKVKVIDSVINRLEQNSNVQVTLDTTKIPAHVKGNR